MALITRRTFDELRDDVIARVGNTGASSAFQSRVEHLVTAAYYFLSLSYFHHELEVFNQALTLSVSSNEKSLSTPGDVYEVMGVTLRSPGGGFAGTTVRRHIRHILSSYENDSGLPTAYAHRGNDLVFDLQPDVAYEVDLLYYKRPTAPDFAGGAASSELHWLHDEHIIQLALSYGWAMTWRFDLATIQKQALDQALGLTSHRPRAEVPVVDRPESNRMTQVAGGIR